MLSNIKRHILVAILTFYSGISFSQTNDSLYVLPNPFSSSASIHFHIVQSDTITLRVLQIDGEPVLTFFQSTILPKGTYEINLSGDGLDDGRIYYVLLEIGTRKSLIRKAIKIGSISGIVDSGLKNNIGVFPNPAKGHITVTLPGSKTIIIADLNGKILKSILTEAQTISLSGIANGLYIMTILNEKNEVITTKQILKID